MTDEPVAVGEKDTAYDFAESTNKYLLDYIKFSDAKAGAISAACAVGIGVLAKISAHGVAAKQNSADCYLWFWAFVVLASVSVLAAFICALMSLLPRTREPAPSLFSYPGIMEHNPKHYAQQVLCMDKFKAVEHLSYQNHNLSGILAQKFDWQKRAVWLVLATVILVAVSSAIALFL